ncbi:MAG: N-6 DNA methylase [Magnetococcales bacterium]|nr:N-6 DNA methylase [Magnetococcales bacterium]
MARRAATATKRTTASKPSLDTLPEIPDEQDGPDLQDGQVLDLITGQTVKLTDVEGFRQEEARKLLEEFGYPQDHLRRDFSIKPIQLKARKLPLVVLRQSTAPRQPDAERVMVLMAIENPKTKADDSKRGAEVLAEFLRDTPHAEYAVWTNGTDRVVYWKESGRIKVRTLLVNDIPRRGHGPEDCFAIGKQALRAASGLSLRQAFQRCHNYIYANDGGSNEAVFWEFLKIVFAKIQDERRLQRATAKGPEEERLFRIADIAERNDPAKAVHVKERIERLYGEVRAAYPELFSGQVDTVQLKPETTAYVVAQIGHYDFLNSSVDVKGEAYEAIVGKNLEGTRGEFFTPRNAVKLAIQILDPNPEDKCIDPACGTGGFIVVILNYIAEKIKRAMREKGQDPDHKDQPEYGRRLKWASQRLFGTDINPNLVRVARMNMVMNDDGQGGITHLDGLDRPERWQFPRKNHKVMQKNGTWTEERIDDFFRRELVEGTFDIVATNPPFGTKIKIDSEAILSQYDLARKWSFDQERGLWSATPTLQNGVAPEILFIERCVKLLKPGSGKLGIVLPDGILGNPDDEYIRVWLLRHCEILALVDMPVELFLPKVGIQTHLVFVRRKSTEEMNRESLGGKANDYPIFMAIAKKVGKDRRANPIYKRDPDGRVLDHFRGFNGQDLHKQWRGATVLDDFPPVDEYGRMQDDDLPFVARAWRKFERDRAKGKVNYDR